MQAEEGDHLGLREAFGEVAVYRLEKEPAVGRVGDGLYEPPEVPGVSEVVVPEDGEVGQHREVDRYGGVREYLFGCFKKPARPEGRCGDLQRSYHLSVRNRARWDRYQRKREGACEYDAQCQSEQPPVYDEAAHHTVRGR